MAPCVLQTICAVLAALCAFLPAANAQTKQKKLKPLETKVENYYGGVFLIGDGGIPEGPCFRIHGRVTAGGFFNQLRSFATDDGTVFRLGPEEVTDFPDALNLSLTIRDWPCDPGLQQVGANEFLTREEMSELKLSLYWKHGVEMRPAGKISVVSTSAEPIEPYAKNLAAELPKRYLWSYELHVPGAGIPLTDSLVLIFRTANGRIVARVAARL
jgi:hypothetical protein